VLGAHRHLRDSIAESTRLLSVLPGEVAPAIERLQAEARDLKRQTKALQTRLAAFEAESLASRAEGSGGMAVVVAQLEGWDANSLKLVASQITTRPTHVAILIGTPAPASVVAARSPDVSLDCAEIVRQLAARFGGKGGGRSELSQGGGLSGEGQELVEFARSLISAG
jgi:alanyl-tRNA synthetase